MTFIQKKNWLQKWLSRPKLKKTLKNKEEHILYMTNMCSSFIQLKRSDCGRSFKIELFLDLQMWIPHYFPQVAIWVLEVTRVTTPKSVM